jgi:hypothetical protein
MSDALTVGNLYESIVKHSDPITGVITVDSVSPARQGGVKCVWAAGIFSAFFGFQTKYYPPIGSKVIMLYWGPTKSFIVGGYPEDAIPNSNKYKKSMTGFQNSTGFDDPVSEAYENAANGTFDSATTPNDLLPGELSLENAQQVGIALLTNLAKLSAGHGSYCV